MSDFILKSKRDAMWAEALKKRGAQYLKSLASARTENAPLERGVPIPTSEYFKKLSTEKAK